MGLLKSVAISLILFIVLSEAANRCYSGQNQHYSAKQCSTGGTTVDFTCQKFVCEGGHSPFEARACSPPGGDCESSRKLCSDNGGSGECYICQGDDCNGARNVAFGIVQGIVFAGISAVTLFFTKSML